MILSFWLSSKRWIRRPSASDEYTPIVVDSLRRIGCPATAAITQKAIDAAEKSSKPIVGIKDDHWFVNPDCLEELGACDAEFFDYTENIADQLFAFIRANKARIAP